MTQSPSIGISMLKLALALCLIFSPSLASAHVGVGDVHGIAHGFMHPIGGIDHLLAMVAVGVFAAHLGGRAMWLVPLSFVSMMVVGGALGMSGITVPFVEIAIGVSVVVLGAIVATQVSPPTVIAMSLVGFFAIFHGYAHGAEMPESASGLAYGLGFVLATASLHALGVGLGASVGLAGQRYRGTITRVAGGATAIAGAAILGGLI